jgi:hypothetical protein
VQRDEFRHLGDFGGERLGVVSLVQFDEHLRRIVDTTAHDSESRTTESGHDDGLGLLAAVSDSSAPLAHHGR